VVSSTAHIVPNDYRVTDSVPRFSLHTESVKDLLLELSMFCGSPENTRPSFPGLFSHSALTSFQTSSSSCHGHCCDWNSCGLVFLDYVYISPDHTFNHPQSPFSLSHQLL